MEEREMEHETSQTPSEMEQPAQPSQAQTIVPEVPPAPEPAVPGAVATDAAPLPSEPLPAEQASAQGQALFAQQMQQITALDPQVNSLADILQTDEFEAFHAHVMSGKDLVSAYKLAFFDKLTQQKAQASRQAAINAMRGTTHLASVGGSAQPAPDALSEAMLAEYRAYMPKASRATIERYHRMHQRGE